MRASLDHLKNQVSDLWPQVTGLELAMVFGSVARGEATAVSDIDLAVVGRGLDTLSITAALEGRLAAPVQVMQLEDPSVVLLAELVRDAVPLYERVPGAYARWLSRTMWQLEDDLPWYQRQERAWLAHLAQGGL